MKRFLPMVCALFVAASADAQGVYNMAKQQARNVANPEGAAPAPAPQYQPAAPNPALQATMQNVNNLRVDFENFATSPTNTLPLTKDLNDAAQGAKPSPADVASLAQDLSAAMAGNSKLAAQHQKLAQYVHALFNSSHLAPAQQQAVLSAVEKMLLAAEVPADDVAKVTGDLKKIAGQTK
jgi:hypothetical protein